eukprot:gene10215-12957_t
MTTKKKAP